MHYGASWAKCHFGASPLERMRVEVRGAVQGVGYRPFVYRLAAQHELTGWVLERDRRRPRSVGPGGTESSVPH